MLKLTKGGSRAPVRNRFPEPIKMWAIRDWRTNEYLPPPRGRGGRGGSFEEPITPSPLNPPRLFSSERAARIALNSWLKGQFHCTRNDDYEIITIKPVPGRNAANMEIVPVTLEFPA